MIRWEIPNRSDPKDQLDECLKLITHLRNNTGPDTINMQDAGWITPFAALIISHAIKQHEGAIGINPPKDEKVAGYLQAIGFPLGGKGKGDTYCPIQHFTTDAQSAVDYVYKIINETFPETLTEGSAIRYIISELCDNIDQHSSFSQAAVIAQKYGGRMNQIAIGVIDNGITIAGSFAKNKLPYENDAEAISQAIRGVSTKYEEGGRGFGLPSSLNIVKRGLGGTVFICSGKGALVSTTDGDKLYILENEGFKGTVVYCLFGTPTAAVSIEKYTG